MIMEYLGKYTDSPRTAEQGKRQILPRPNPGENEHRVYFNFREETRVFDEVEEVIPVADFVSCLSNQVPTSEDWENLLKDNGFTQSQIDNILN